MAKVSVREELELMGALGGMRPEQIWGDDKRGVPSMTLVEFCARLMIARGEMSEADLRDITANAPTIPPPVPDMRACNIACARGECNDPKHFAPPPATLGREGLMTDPARYPSDRALRAPLTTTAQIVADVERAVPSLRIVRGGR